MIQLYIPLPFYTCENRLPKTQYAIVKMIITNITKWAHKVEPDQSNGMKAHSSQVIIYWANGFEYMSAAPCWPPSALTVSCWYSKVVNSSLHSEMESLKIHCVIKITGFFKNKIKKKQKKRDLEWLKSTSCYICFIQIQNKPTHPLKVAVKPVLEE